jgi:hypothetical protein
MFRMPSDPKDMDVAEIPAYRMPVILRHRLKVVLKSKYGDGIQIVSSQSFYRKSLKVNGRGSCVGGRSLECYLRNGDVEV